MASRRQQKTLGVPDPQVFWSPGFVIIDTNPDPSILPSLKTDVDVPQLVLVIISKKLRCKNLSMDLQNLFARSDSE